MSSEAAQWDLTQLGHVVVGGDVVRRTTLGRLHELLRPARLVENCLFPSYGMAETSSIITTANDWNNVKSPDSSNSAAVSSGKPLAGTQVKVVDDQGVEVPDGVRGHMWVAGYSVMSEYANNTVATEEAFERKDQESWLVTGDHAFVHNEQIWVTGRDRNLLLHAG